MSTQLPPAEKSKGPLIIAGLVIVLLILHQDNWFWTSRTMVLGFIPIGLFWHACLSIAASVTWFLATQLAWPTDDSVPTANANPAEEN